MDHPLNPVQVCATIFLTMKTILDVKKVYLMTLENVSKVVVQIRLASLVAQLITKLP